MEIRKLYVDLSACQIDLQNNQKHQKAQTRLCNEYFNCVQDNSHLVEQYKRLAPEISRDFVTQDFDTNKLAQNFKRLEMIDTKIHNLQHTKPEIRKYLKAELPDIELAIQQFTNDMYFDQMDEAEEWIDSVFHELDRRKQERIDNIEQWKSTGEAVVKGAGNFIWKLIK